MSNLLYFPVIAGQRLVSTGFLYRFLGAVWCLSAVVFASAYVGILVSFLRFPKLTPIVNKLEDLPESQLKWCVLRGTALESLFTVIRNEAKWLRIDKEITLIKTSAGSYNWSLQDHWR